MIANYHTHTWRCGHASGTEEEYVLNAIERGLKLFGFSDHTPYCFPYNYYSHFRMKPEQLEDYARTVLELRGRYADRIDIHLGAEAEYYPEFFSDTLAMLRDGGVEYLLLAMHFIDNEIGAAYSGKPTDDEALLSRYCHQAMEAMETGLFTYFAHPDLFRFTGNAKIYDKHMRDMCRKAKECAVPLEINLLGVGENRHYPHLPFWDIAADEGCSAVIGMDAHWPEVILDPQPESRAVQLAAERGINVLQTVPIRKI